MKSVIVWQRNGDHPDDGVGNAEYDPLTGEKVVRIEGRVVGYYRDPGVPGVILDCRCNKRWRDHGWIDDGVMGQIVCPGDLIITEDDGTHRVQHRSHR